MSAVGYQSEFGSVHWQLPDMPLLYRCRRYPVDFPFCSLHPDKTTSLVG